MISKEELESALKKCYDFCEKNAIPKEDFIAPFNEFFHIIFCDNKNHTFRTYVYSDTYKCLMVYALYKKLFNSELFSLESYLDELLQVGSTFSNCAVTHIVLCKYKRKKLKVSYTYIDYKNEPKTMEENLDFSNDFFNAAYMLGISSSLYSKTSDKISNDDLMEIEKKFERTIQQMKKVKRTINSLNEKLVDHNNQ